MQATWSPADRGRAQDVLLSNLSGLHGRVAILVQFTTVQERPGNTDQGTWSSLNRSGPPRPELLMRRGLAAKNAA